MPWSAIYDENLDLARVDTKLIKPSRGAHGAPETGESGTKHENPLHCSKNPFVGIRMSSNKIARTTTGRRRRPCEHPPVIVMMSSRQHQSYPNILAADRGHDGGLWHFYEAATGSELVSFP